ncbi:ATP-binding cassette domain-containing protein [Mesorhizobium sp. AR10]|uniref:ATP-binding cassette domain-containing protein n=1 Tax=Mesorhizobium sp. AR10 TaxID=2865839 RepID=UPI00215E1F1C|nr:ATP-binding cassette domain-containing protein [Mesorhizobium sp. AR10]UVK41159.1 ATP-binding cassette domain-containing protein [Mesorhizobium sp. AR10]
MLDVHKTPAFSVSSAVVPILESQGIAKHYGGVIALTGADLRVMPGEIVAIVGDNGAGKSTFVKIVSGAQPADDGKLFVTGREMSFHRPSDAREAGIETVYQDLSLAEHLDVLSNLFLGREEFYVNFGGLSILNRKKMATRAEELLNEIGVNVPGVRDIVGGLSGGQRQGVAIARAAGWGSQLIIMDEPTAALGVQETAHVHDIIRALQGRGVAVLLVSHNMKQVMELSDRVYVFRRGRIVRELVTKDTSTDEIIGYITGARGSSQ